MNRSALCLVRIEPGVCNDALAVLDEGESLAAFVNQCVRSGIAWRRTQDAFLVRARDAVERGIREGSGIAPEELLKRMDDGIAAALLRVKRSER